jgi:stress response protein SCP2
MSVNLSKGQKVNLSKQRYGLSKVMVGLGWDEVQQQGGLFGRFKAKPQDIDCDAFAILLGYDGKLINHATKLSDCTVFFNNLRWPNGSIQHMGDNLTGAGEGDDEQIFVDLNNVPQNVCGIVFAVNIYEAFKRNQHFGMIRNAFIRVVDYDRQTELCRFNLSENYNNQTALIAGSLVRTNEGWEFITDGTAARVESLVNVVSAFAD